MFLDNAVRVKYLITIQVSFLLRRRRTLLANAIPWRSGVTARTGASPVPTIRRLGRPARRIVGVPLAGTLVRFPLSFASKVRRRWDEGERRGAPCQGALQVPWNHLLNSYNTC